MSTIEANTLKPISGSSTLTLGESGDTVSLGSGVTAGTGIGTTINNNADNRVITGSGTANTLEAESNFTFASGVVNITSSDAEPLELTRNTSNGDVNLRFKNTSGDIAFIRGVHGGHLAFLPNGNEKVRMKENGEILLGKTSNGFNANGGMITDGGEKVTLTRDGNGELCFVSNFINCNGYHSGMYYSGSLVGSIYQTHASTTFNTSSDYRLKENKEDVVDGIERLKQLKPYKFNWKSDPNEVKVKVDGFYAHEVSPVVPEAITGEKDAVDEEGKIIPQQIDQSKLVPLLTSALQEAITKIETLEAKVAALESA